MLAEAGKSLQAPNIALGAEPVADCEAGDANADGEISIDELIRAVRAALEGCPPSPRERCLASGGTVTSGLCCIGVGDFPDTCAIGVCGCAPDFSEEALLCDCGPERCFGARGCVGSEP